MTILFTILHVLVSLFLILVVLAQQGKGQDLASAFGGAGSQTAFGARGTATLLSKVTAGAAVLFMVTSLTLTYLRPPGEQRTVVPDAEPPAETTGGTEEAAPPATTAPADEPATEPSDGAGDVGEPKAGATTTSPPEEPK
jgi:preprotein translocase subunit SecG